MKALILAKILVLIASGMAALGLTACGNKSSDNNKEGLPTQPDPTNSSPTQPVPSENNPVELKLSGVAFLLTKPLTQWKMNTIIWAGAKHQKSGFVEREILPILGTAGTPNYSKYKFGWEFIAATQCDGGADTSTKVKLTLKTLTDSKVTEERDLKLEEPLEVVQGKHTYKLRVDVLNTANCESIELQLGLAALR